MIESIVLVVAAVSSMFAGFGLNEQHNPPTDDMEHPLLWIDWGPELQCDDETIVVTLMSTVPIEGVRFEWAYTETIAEVETFNMAAGETRRFERDVPPPGKFLYVTVWDGVQPFHKHYTLGNECSESSTTTSTTPVSPETPPVDTTTQPPSSTNTTTAASASPSAPVVAVSPSFTG